MAKILLVEDNVGLSGVLVPWLKSQNYSVDLAETGEDALQILCNYKYDLLILDWELPGIDGNKVCQNFRGQGGVTPVLFLTGRADIDSKTMGLDNGADDYLTKPFDFLELKARIKALLRRPSTLLQQSLSASGLTLELETRSALIGTSQVTLTQREFMVLDFLLRNPNRYHSSHALLDAVWPLETAFSEDTVRSCMRRLRQKITVEGQECIIKSVQGLGYIINSNQE